MPCLFRPDGKLMGHGLLVSGGCEGAEHVLWSDLSQSAIHRIRLSSKCRPCLTMHSGGYLSAPPITSWLVVHCSKNIHQRELIKYKHCLGDRDTNIHSVPISSVMFWYSALWALWLVLCVKGSLWGQHTVFTWWDQPVFSLHHSAQGLPEGVKGRRTRSNLGLHLECCVACWAGYMHYSWEGK